MKELARLPAQDDGGPTPPVVLDADQWRPMADAHGVRARKATAAHLARRKRGQRHPGEDFLFEYYGFRPAQLVRWHPGPGVGLRDASERADWRWYRTDGGVTRLDVDCWRDARGRGASWVLDLLRRINAREPVFSCFGLHEWAMVYRLEPEQVRHQALPLRLAPEQVTEVVESHEIRCTHFDAFRFFTDAARPLNVLQPTRDGQPEMEQPGCLHGGAMDLYRWSFKLTPAVPSDIVMDAFDLARRARTLDMRSSLYDVRPLGMVNIPIETAAGKAEHVREQRAIADAANPIRNRLINAIEAAF